MFVRSEENMESTSESVYYAEMKLQFHFCILWREPFTLSVIIGDKLLSMSKPLDAV